MPSKTLTLHVSCVVLVSVTECAAGKKFVPAQNGNPAKCEACPHGTFNADHDDSKECTTHNPCTGTTVKEPGTAIKDAVCNKGVFIYIYTRRIYSHDPPNKHTHTHTNSL